MLVNYYVANAPGIIIPHISRTGSVPIKIINEGWGFLTTYGPKTIDFLAVGTNKEQNFDYFRDQPPYLNWHHDWEHSQRANRLDANHELHQLVAKKVTSLRKAMAERQADELQRNQTELAFFSLFHESQTYYDQEITTFLTFYIKTLQQELKEGVEETDNSFGSIKQFETNVMGAKSLKLPITGETILDQQASFLQHLLKGYEILLSLADHYNGIK